MVGSFHSSTEMLSRYPDVSNEVDIVVFDVFIDGSRPAFGTLRAMCQAGQRVIVYSHLSTYEVSLTCLDMGAVAYLVKTEGQRHLIDAIQAAHSSEPDLGPQMANALANDRASGRANLSEREKEVLKLIPLAEFRRRIELRDCPANSFTYRPCRTYRDRINDSVDSLPRLHTDRSRGPNSG